MNAACPWDTQLPVVALGKHPRKVVMPETAGMKNPTKGFLTKEACVHVDEFAGLGRGSGVGAYGCSSSHRVAFLLSTRPGPTCTGIQRDDVCCPNSCGECGGTTVEPRYRRVHISRTAYQRTLYVLEERTYVCTYAMHVDASLHTQKSSCNPESTRPRHPPCTYDCALR